MVEGSVDLGGFGMGGTGMIYELARVKATTATFKKAWDSLYMSFANKSQTRMFSFRDFLGKVSKLVAEYLCEILFLFDELATTRAPISNEELLVKILSGLGSKFCEMYATIRALESLISYE
ncbi:hypothetical protein ACH5RR_008522 [Cinchona calisaya]|uniref:Uncharacterized protein n=1 Tax=Cinchona calisaya TaxID=153742 RepID=A0ABD3AFG9_9GENT